MINNIIIIILTTKPESFKTKFGVFCMIIYSPSLSGFLSTNISKNSFCIHLWENRVISHAVPKINDSCIVYILISLFLSTTFHLQCLVKIHLQPAPELATWKVRISMHQCAVLDIIIIIIISNFDQWPSCRRCRSALKIYITSYLEKLRTLIWKIKRRKVIVKLRKVHSSQS